MVEADKVYRVGRYDLVLPGDHALDRYQQTWRRYDTALGYIAKLVFTKYPDSAAIDVGANVGDSVALIRSYAEVPVLCIEGSPAFVSYLRGNTSRLANIDILECFVGTEGAAVDVGQLASARGTTSVVGATRTDPAAGADAPMRSLETILRDHPRYASAKLLKIDTDGFDFAILRTSSEMLARTMPVVHFEYDVCFRPDGEAESIAAITTLVKAGYVHFVVYDNFGNFMSSFSSGVADRFGDFNTCLLSNRVKSGTPAIYYLDVCAFVGPDRDLFDQLVTLERMLARNSA